ncbi:hypothetical protein HRS9122_00280 [Pyrenophora teres f. teres]|nr:hypothetical protein HRS9122_00280 [Pyrenophora teres f. teres]
MHPSTIAAILAFTAGMPASAAPAFGRNDPHAGLLHIAIPPTTKEQTDFLNRISSRASGGLRVGKSFEGEHEGDATSIVADVITIDQAVQGSQLNAKRDAQRSRGRVIGNIGEAVGGVIGGAADLITIGGIIGGQPAQKREAQRSRGRVFGNIIEGVGGAIGGAVDLIAIGGAVQGQGQPAQKRDAQRSRGRVFGNIIEGVGGAIGGAVDLITIGGAVQGQGQPAQKRDAQRSRGRVIGNIGEAVGGVIGGAADLITIGGLVGGQPAQKRDAQRSRGRVIGNIGEVVGGVIGGAADLLTINEAVQGQGQPAQKREAQRSRGRVIGNIGEAVGGVIGGAADLITIGGLVGGQPAQKRDAQRSRGRVIGNIGEVVGGVIGGAADLLTINEAVGGGDSIAAIKLVGEARTAGINLTVADLFRCPTLAAFSDVDRDDLEDVFTDNTPFSLLDPSVDIAQVCEEAARSTNIDAHLIENIYPCSPLQEGLISLTTKRAGEYVMRKVLGLRADIDQDAFRAAWEQVIRSTAIMRTRIVQNSKLGLLQVVTAEPTKWAEAESQDEYMDQDMSTSMGLGDTLSRYAIVKERYRAKKWFIWTAHHALYDG